MLEKDLIQDVTADEKKGVRKKFNVNKLYRFFMDREDIADNQVKKWNTEP